MFFDEAEIYVQSGRGGDGMVHFHKEKYVPRAARMEATAAGAGM